MANKHEIEKELEALSPNLAKLKKLANKQTGNVPDGYFKNLENELEAKLFAKETIQNKTSSSKKTVKMSLYGVLAIAASIALFFMFKKPIVQYPELNVSANEL
ncbi:MAG: hypothetical protein ACPGLV_07475, partial [Bacteroidia bacterium]